MQQRNEKNVDSSFKRVIKAWLKSVKNFQLVDPLAAQIMDGFEKIKSLDKKYNSILTWCYENEKSDLIILIKNRFLELHHREFASRLHKRSIDQQTILKKLSDQEMQDKIDYQKQQNSFDRMLEEQNKYYQQLEKVAREFIDLQFNSQASESEYQSSVVNLKNVAKKVKNLPFVPQVVSLNVQQNPKSLDILEENKIKVLHQLDRDILKCETDFAKEKWWQKVLSYFSPARRRHLAEIKIYKEKLQPISDVDQKYEGVLRWTKKITDDPSTFISKCIRPFKYAENQIRFERLPFLYDQSQTEIDQVFEVQEHSYHSQKEKIQLLNNELQSVQDRSNVLSNLLMTTSKHISTIKEAGVFGFVRNSAADIAHSIKKIADFIDAADPALKTAQEVVQQVTLINPNTPLDKITILADKAQSVKKNTKAMNAIQDTVEKVIQDTLCYGGKANNYQFMGATQAERVVNLLGTDKQKTHFKKIKQESDQRAKQYYLDLEQVCVEQLSRSIETKELEKKLLTWRDALLQHNKMDGRMPTADSENIYSKEIKPAVKDAALFHTLGQKALENFITTAMHSALNASQYDLKNKYQSSGIHSLNWEQVDTLVKVYGTKDQIYRWNHTLLPHLNCRPVVRLMGA